MIEAYYFGCVLEAGHFLWNENLIQSSRYEKRLPFAMHILDAGLLPQNDREQIEGIVYRNIINGWTVCSFWDRSVDARGMCNSSFIFQGSHSFEKCLELAKEKFPSVMARFKFNLVPASI